MSDHCCKHDHSVVTATDERYRRVLWTALWINAVMFAVEVVSAYISGSVSLLADALDFAGDAANYGLSLVMLSLGLLWRARGALVKGFTMGAFGVFVLTKAGLNIRIGVPPDPMIMSVIGLLALAANVIVAMMLYAFRKGNADMRSVWLCTRNDAIGNLAVILAALGVFGTGSAWPDLIVAIVMGGLAVWSAQSVVRQALREIRSL
ncbi:MAG TPA: cation diffusion facilitator family transporter [Gammaproteobacteria bacterium]